MPALDNLSRAAQISLTVARRAGTLALSTARQVADMAVERRSRSRARTTWTPPPPVSSAPASTQPREAPPAAPAPAPARAPGSEPAAAATPAPSLEVAPEHVDREAVVVAESADDGAADGAGAQVRIGAPWDGYDGLTVKEVNDRLAAASPESLAVARLYETANRNRVTVIKEIDRRLAAAAG